MKIKDIKYIRQDINKAISTLSEITNKVKEARSGKDLIALRERSIAVSKKIQSAYTLAYIRFTLDTTSQFYLEEKNYYDENIPALSAISAKFNKAFLTSPYLKDALEFMNENVAKIYELSLKIMDEKIVPDLVKESKLVTRYDKIMSEKTFFYKGKDLPLSVLKKYFDDTSRKTRKSSMEALGKGLSEISDEIEDIFDKLVKLRAKMAKKMGFSSYSEMGDCQMGRYSYGRKEIKKFKEETKKSVTPLVTKMKNDLKKRLGIDNFMLYDNEICFLQGNPTPVLNKKETFAVAKKMYHDMSAETGAFIDYMLSADAFDVDARKGKWGGGYCTGIDEYKLPFILANFNGSSGDIDVLTHEAGHAFAYYEAYNSEVDYELGLGTMSVAEIHSMAMEFFAWKYMDEFFGKRANDYRYSHLASSLTFIPYGVMVDEFEDCVYANPEMSKKERNDLWNVLDNYYRPYLSTMGIPYIEKGTRWQYQMHIFENPKYYIDYCLSQSVAHQFLVEAQENYEKSFNKYIKLLKKGGELPFEALVESVGLKNPLLEGVLTESSIKIEKILNNLTSKISE